MPGRDGSGGLPPDASIVERLLAGDVDCFAAVLDAWGPGLQRFTVALLPCRGGSAAGPDADAVAWAAWMAALGNLTAFAGVVSLKAWLYRHVLDVLPEPVSFSVCLEDTAPVVDPGRFRPPDAPLYPGGWQEGQLPPRWPVLIAADAATPGLLRDSLASLPARQRAVILLRDAEGCDPGDVSWLLGIDLADQRVLLQAARASLRNAIDGYYTRLSSGKVSRRGL